MKLLEQYLKYIHEEDDPDFDESKPPKLRHRPGFLVGSNLGSAAASLAISQTKPVKAAGLSGLAKVMMIPNLIIAGLAIYHFYLSKAAKACKGETHKVLCINKYKVKGMEQAIQELKKNIKKCKETENPEQCKRAILRKIYELEETITYMKGQQEYLKGKK